VNLVADEGVDKQIVDSLRASGFTVLYIAEPTASSAEAEWTWENTRRWQRTIALQATPEQRLAWLEEMIALAHAHGARKPGFGQGSGTGAGK
jgi:hypothetical protein